MTIFLFFLLFAFLFVIQSLYAGYSQLRKKKLLFIPILQLLILLSVIILYYGKLFLDIRIIPFLVVVYIILSFINTIILWHSYLNENRIKFLLVWGYLSLALLMFAYMDSEKQNFKLTEDYSFEATWVEEHNHFHTYLYKVTPYWEYSKPVFVGYLFNAKREIDSVALVHYSKNNKMVFIVHSEGRSTEITIDLKNLNYIGDLKIIKERNLEERE